MQGDDCIYYYDGFSLPPGSRGDVLAAKMRILFVFQKKSVKKSDWCKISINIIIQINGNKSENQPRATNYCIFCYNHSHHFNTIEPLTTDYS
jgi:hypothetical protein